MPAPTAPPRAERLLTQPQRTPHSTSPHITSPHLTSPRLASPHLASPHLTSPHLTRLTPHRHRHPLFPSMSISADPTVGRPANPRIRHGAAAGGLRGRLALKSRLPHGGLPHGWAATWWTAPWWTAFAAAWLPLCSFSPGRDITHLRKHNLVRLAEKEEVEGSTARSLAHKPPLLIQFYVTDFSFHCSPSVCPPRAPTLVTPTSGIW